MAWRNTLAGARDHSRVPMNWDTSPHYGFSEATPWLKRPVEDKGWSIQEQEEQEDSVLNFTRTLSNLRREHKVLRLGSNSFHQEQRKNYLAYTRQLDGSHLFIELNLSDQPLRRKTHDKILVLSMSAKLLPTRRSWNLMKLLSTSTNSVDSKLHRRPSTPHAKMLRPSLHPADR